MFAEERRPDGTGPSGLLAEVKAGRNAMMCACVVHDYKLTLM